jgi:hypothetical protein
MPIGSPNAGYLTFNTGQILTAAQVQYNLQNQTIMYFATTTARDTALPIGTRQEGMACYIAADQSVQIFNGTAWVSFTGDITGLTAGSGITITNPGGPVPTIALSTNATLTSPKETVTLEPTGAATTVNIETQTASVKYITGAASADWTTNVTASVSPAVTLNSTMAIGEQISVVLMNTNTASAYKPTGFTIDGTAVGVTLEWLGGTAPASGNANSIDVYVYTIIKTASAVYTVLASQNRFA